MRWHRRFRCHLYIFTRDREHLNYQGKLTPSDAIYNSNLYKPGATSVALDGDAAILQVTAAPIPGKEPAIEGNIRAAHSIVTAIYLSTRIGNTWTKQAKLTASGFDSVDCTSRTPPNC